MKQHRRERSASSGNDSSSSGDNNRSSTSENKAPVLEESLVDRTDFDGHSITQFTKLFKPLEFLITTDHFPIWRRHLAWSKDGKELRHYITSRMSSNMVVLTLLLNAMLGFLFNSSDIPSHVREDLYHSKTDSMGYFIGVLVVINMFVTVYALIANFTAWGMVMAISEENASPLLRSPLGQYTMQLATRLVIMSLVLFLIWCTLMVVYMMGIVSTVVLTLASTGFYLHMVSVYTAFGRVIMHTGAMEKKPMFTRQEIERLMPDDLHDKLLEKSKTQASRQVSPQIQYTEGRFKSWWHAIVKQEAITKQKKQTETTTENSSSSGDEDQRTTTTTTKHKQQTTYLEGFRGKSSSLATGNNKTMPKNKQQQQQNPFEFLEEEDSMSAMEEGRSQDSGDESSNEAASSRKKESHKGKEKQNQNKEKKTTTILKDDEEGGYSSRPTCTPACFDGQSIKRESSNSSMPCSRASKVDEAQVRFYDYNDDEEGENDELSPLSKSCILPMRQDEYPTHWEGGHELINEIIQNKDHNTDERNNSKKIDHSSNADLKKEKSHNASNRNNKVRQQERRGSRESLLSSKGHSNLQRYS